MLSVDRAVGKFFLTEIGPVNISTFYRCPCIRIISYIFLDIMILEKNNVGELAVIACTTGCSDSCLDIGRTRYFIDDELEIRIDIGLVIICRCLKCRNVEVSIPC